MIQGSCHCGNIQLRVAELPTELISCNCSLCHRLGGLWAYYTPDQLDVTTRDQPTVQYVQGDRTLATHHCPTCGCVSHWTSLDPASQRVGVNARLLPRTDTEQIVIHRFDGADTWRRLD